MVTNSKKKTTYAKTDISGRTELHYAAEIGDLRKAEELISAGIDVNAADDDGWTPLHVAAHTQFIDIAELLITHGANINPRDSHGNTPLHRAVLDSRGYGTMIQLLRENGADPHADNNYGITPLVLARSITIFDVQQFFSDLP